MPPLRKAGAMPATAPQTRAIGRAQRAVTKRRISLALIENARREAEANGASPLRLLRLSRGLTIEQAAYAALVGERTYRRAEVAPDDVSDPSWRRIAASLGVAVSDIKG